MTIETIISLIGLLLGGGSIGGVISWRYAKAKAKAEADTVAADAEKAHYEAIQASVAATKEVQDSYQQLIADFKSDREEQRQYITELKEDRQHLREERDEQRKRQDFLEETVRDLQRQVARNGRAVESMRPFICTDLKCKKRVRGVISESGEVENTEE